MAGRRPRPRRRRGSPEAFDALVDRALASIPARFRRYLQNVVVSVEKAPSRELRERMGLSAGDSLYGLYEGTPLDERAHGQTLMPDRIVIFRRPLLEDFGDDRDEIVEQVRITVLHEIGHHFGLDEDAMQTLEQDE